MPMNPPTVPTAFWTLLGTLGLEMILIAAAAWLVQWRLKRASWRYVVWEAAFVCLALLILAELSGMSRAINVRRAAPLPPASSPVAVTQFFDPSPALSFVRVPVEAPILVSPALAESPTLLARSSLAWGWLIVLWPAGVALLLVRFGFYRVRFALFRRGCRRLDSALWAERLKDLSWRLGYGRMVRLFEHPGLQSPIAFGILRPAICLPPQFTESYSHEQQDAMLVHELCHLSSHDTVWHTLAGGVAALLWWHPAAWWMRRKLRETSEMAADEAAFLLDNGPVALAESLVDLGRRLIGEPVRPGSPQAPPVWLGVTGGGFKSGLGRRVELLFHLHGQARPWHRLKTLPALACKVFGPLFLALGVMSGFAWAQDSDASNSTWHQLWNESVLGRTLSALMPARTQADSSPGENSVWVGDLWQEDGSAYVTPDQAVFHLEQNAVFLSDVWQDDASPNVDPLLVSHIVFSDAVVYAANVPTFESELVVQSLDPAATTVLSFEPVSKEEPLLTRWFKIDPITMDRGIQEMLSASTIASGVSNAPASAGASKAPGPAVGPTIQERLDRMVQFFKAAGVDLTVTNRTLFFNDRLNTLMVRATKTELDIVEQAIQVLNASPPQLTLEVKLAEYTGEDAFTPDIRKLLPLSTNVTNLVVTGILTDPQFRTVVRALEQRAGVDVLSMPKVTTLSGRPAQVKAVDVRYIVTDLDVSPSAADPREAQPGVKTVSSPSTTDPKAIQAGTLKSTEPSPRPQAMGVQPIAEPYELGPVIDLIPYVAADGQTIQLTVIATIKEFLGYDKKDEFQAFVRDLKEDKKPARPVTAPTPLPQFRLRQVLGSAQVRDGQTVALQGGSITSEFVTKGKVRVLGDLPLLGRLFRSEKKQSARKQLLIFVTPTLIDPAGNRIHALAEPPVSADPISERAKSTRP